jgi:hypothetical protein
MATSQEGYSALQISPERLLTLIQDMLSSTHERPGDEQPLPPGPWDPAIRAALHSINPFGNPANSWEEFILSILAQRFPAINDVPRGGGGNIFERVALNPQPLPPRQAFLKSLTQTIVERTELLQEMAAAFSDGSEERGIIIVSGYLSRFLDEFCGTGYKLRFPHPGPRPTWFPDQLDASDLVVMAAYFQQAAKETFYRALGEQLSQTSTKLLQAGISATQ